MVSAFPSAFAGESGTVHIHELYLVLPHCAVDRKLNEFDGSGVLFLHRECVGVLLLPTRISEQQCCMEILSCGRYVSRLVVVDAVPAGVPLALAALAKSIPFPLLRKPNLGCKVPRATWLVVRLFSD